MENDLNYNDILEASAGNNISIQNNYKFDAMLRAIDIFSQKFNMEMMIDFAGDFANEILTLGSSAVFIYRPESDAFVLAKSRLYGQTLTKVPNSRKLQDMAVLYGTIIYRNFTLFFSEDFIQIFHPALVIPFIHSGKLQGFIVSSGKVLGDFTEDDLSMAKAMMNLFNDAFERNHYLEELSYKEKILDNKIFDLYTVNKASKILFSEISLEKLQTVAVEIFSEVSGSLFTTFGVLDKASNALVATAYSDVLNSDRKSRGFSIALKNSHDYDKENCIWNVEKDMTLLKEIFVNPEVLNDVEAEYIVLIVKEKILGYVTLGKTKKGDMYTEEELELVNSLAINCFIALNNALLFEEIVAQKNEIEDKYAKLVKATDSKN